MRILKLIECVTLAGLLICAQPIEEAEAQWNTLPPHAMGVSQGPGYSSPNPVGPCTSGYFIGGTGASSDPTCQGFLQSGTGAVTRTWQAKSRDVISVMDFSSGASPTNAEVAAAIAASQAAGRCLYFPAGTYSVTGPFTLDILPCLFGEGKYRTVISTNSATATLFDVTSSGFIENLTITSSVPRTAGSYINISGAATFFDVNRVYMLGAFYGVTSSSPFLRITESDFTDTVAVLGVDINIQDGGAWLDRIIASNNPAFAPFAHIAIFKAGEVSGRRLDLVSAIDNLYIGPNTGATVGPVQFVESGFDTATGDNIRFFGKGTIAGFMCSNCWASNAASNGVHIEMDTGGIADGITFDGLLAFNNGARGVYAKGSGVKSVSVTGGSQFANNATSAIHYEDINGGSILGNRIGPTASVGLNGTGIVLAGASDHLNVQDNDLRGNTSPFSYGTSGTDITIANNVGFDPIISPAQITSNQNDYAPTGIYATDALVINSDAARDITGIAAYARDKTLYVFNSGSFTITLKNNSGSSGAANRFQFGSDVALAASTGIALQYTVAPTAGWRTSTVSSTLISGRIAYSQLAQGSALSVLGVTGNATADLANIAAGSDANILRRSGTSLGFGSIDLSASGAVGTSRLAFANLTQLATNTVLGNATSGTADASAQTVPSCSTSGSALKWTTNTGFGCNSSIDAATLLTKTWASPDVIGSGTPQAITGVAITATAGITSGGTVAGYSANKAIMQWQSIGSVAQFLATGPDTSTVGAMVFALASSNASVYAEPINLTSTQLWNKLTTAATTTTDGAMRVDGGLSVAGAVVNGTYVNVGTKIRAGGSAPTLTAGCNGAGSSITGSDLAGTVTAQNSGTPTTCTITFNATYASAPYCVVIPEGGAAGNGWFTTTAAGTLQVTWTTGTNSQKFNYHCIGRSGG